MNTIWRDRLGREVLIGSGAIGTSLRGRSPSQPVELLNLRNPDGVRALHAAYREAGSDILVTNTHAANPIALAEYGLADECEGINRAGVRLAREAGGESGGDICVVWASVGPLGLGLRLEDMDDDGLAEVYRRQCRALGEADALLLETFTDLRESRAALWAASESGRPVVFQIGNTGGGPQQWARLDALIEAAHAAGAAALGANCRHPGQIVAVTEYISARTERPVSASPNAGHPRVERGRVIYDFSPDELVAVGRRLAAAGAAVIGGCCGTTPDHIRRLSEALRGRLVSAGGPRIRLAAAAGPAAGRAEGGTNPVRAMVESPGPVVSVEIRAERMKSLDEVVAGAAKVVEAGADLLDVPDNPGATVGRDAMVTAARLQDKLGVPVIWHLVASQSNLLRMHAGLLGGWDLGVRGILALTGDAPGMGHLADMARRVTDLRSSVELLRLIRRLGKGEMINGEHVADPPDFCAGCALGRATPAQAAWLAKKAEAGAEFTFSQPVFTFDDYEALRDLAGKTGVRLFPGVLPLVGLKNAEFLAGERIPGIVVSSAVVEAFRRYASVEDQRRHGLERAMELAGRIMGDCRRLYLIMPFGKRCYDEAALIVHAVKGESGSRASAGPASRAYPST